jgi:hypothetical protein
MKHRSYRYGLVAVIGSTALLYAQAVRAEAIPSPRDSAASPALANLAAAAQADQYAYVLFWKQNNVETQRMQQVAEGAMPQLNGAARLVSVNVRNPNEKATVEKFGVDRAPMPLLVAVAPNGAITKAWPLKCEAAQIREGIVSAGTAQCVKALQDGKLVFVSVQNKESAHRQVTALAIDGFRADPRFANVSETVVVNPSDAREATFLNDLGVKSPNAEVTTVLLAPPGKPLATFVGMVSTEEIIAKVTAAQSGYCPGGKCGPGGCCPGGQCGPAK